MYGPPNETVHAILSQVVANMKPVFDLNDCPELVDVITGFVEDTIKAGVRVANPHAIVTRDTITHAAEQGAFWGLNMRRCAVCSTWCDLDTVNEHNVCDTCAKAVV